MSKKTTLLPKTSKSSDQATHELETSLQTLSDKDSKLTQRIEELSANTKTAFDKVALRFNAVDQRIDRLEKNTNERFDRLEKSTNERFDAVDQRFDTMDQEMRQQTEMLKMIAENMKKSE